MNHEELKHPWMRLQLISCLESLKDKGYQIAAWVNQGLPEGKADWLDISVHFLFDDTQLAENPISCIGWFLKNEDEAELIGKLCRELDEIFNKYGTELTDAEYISLQEWDRVLVAADKAYCFMTGLKSKFNA
jgi:hypothetical protein